MTVSVQNLRNVADYMKNQTGIDPAWLRAAADEIERLRAEVASLKAEPRILNSNSNSFM